MEHLYVSNNNENIHGDSNNSIEAPRDFSLSFGKDYLVFKIEFELTKFGFSTHFLFDKIWKERKGYNMSIWNFPNNLEVQEQFG